MQTCCMNGGRVSWEWDFTVIWISYRKEGNRLFSRVCGDGTRGNGFKLNEVDLD